MGEYAFLAVYRSSYGMNFADLSAKGNGMVEAWLILGVEWCVFMVLAWYLEQVRADTAQPAGDEFCCGPLLHAAQEASTA
jgi:hypothetical protein